MSIHRRNARGGNPTQDDSTSAQWPAARATTGSPLLLCVLMLTLLVLDFGFHILDCVAALHFERDGFACGGRAAAAQASPRRRAGATVVSGFACPLGAHLVPSSSPVSVFTKICMAV